MDEKLISARLWRAMRLPAAFAVLLTSIWIVPARSATGDLSPDGVWREVAPSSAPAVAASGGSVGSFRTYALDEFQLFRILMSAPHESEGSTSPATLLSLPLPDGRFARFRVVETALLSTELQVEMPDAHAYIGTAVDMPGVTARLDRTSLGFHGMIRMTDDFAFVEPMPGDAGTYRAYRYAEVRPSDDMRCEVSNALGPISPESITSAPSGSQLRTYDMGVAVTSEYTNRFGGIVNARNQIMTTVNQLNGIYEPEVAIRFRVVCTAVPPAAGADRFPTPETVDADLDTLTTEVLNDTCGVNGYQIGHLFHRRAGTDSYSGRADFATVCGAFKGNGVSTGTDPTTSLFLIDLLAHEVGHQFDARHIFNTTTGICGAARSNNDAFEIASGTTIMSYAFSGCTEDIAGTAVPFFNTHSFDQITNFRDAGGACGAATATGNTPPTVNGGLDYTIPRNTPFTLTATGSDPDGQPITFNWEQQDRGASSPPLNGSVSGPLFRGFNPSASPARTFPRYTDYLAGTTPFEFLPTVNRTLTFRVTARDNRTGGGGVNNDQVTLTVQGDPFRVDFPNGGEELLAGCPVTVRWTIGGGSVAANVNIRFSNDGGATFPTVLVANTPNDGSQDVQLPCASTTTARIRVEAADNIFFDISDANFRVINDVVGPTVAVQLDRTVLWPPNHKLATIRASVQVGDNCASVRSFVLKSVTSDEPENGPGDGNTSPDIFDAAVGTPDTTFQLRSERAGGGDGRTYTIVYESTDGCGNVTLTTVRVEVPHDHSGAAFVAQGLTAGGSRIDPSAEAIAIVVPSRIAAESDENLEGVEGGSSPHERGHIETSLSFDARTVRTETASLGNLRRVLSPLYAESRDATGDGVVDRVLVFAAAPVRELVAESGAGTLALRFETDEPQSYLVESILSATRVGAIAELLSGKMGEETPDITGAHLSTPSVSCLRDVRPNPFSGSTTIALDVALAAKLEVAVFDASGRRVKTLASGERAAGRYTLTWNGRDEADRLAPAGLYFLRLTGAGIDHRRKVIRLH